MTNWERSTIHRAMAALLPCPVCGATVEPRDQRWFEACGLEDLSATDLSIGVSRRMSILNPGSSYRNDSQSQNIAVDYEDAALRPVAAPIPVPLPQSMDAANLVS